MRLKPMRSFALLLILAGCAKQGMIRTYEEQVLGFSLPRTARVTLTIRAKERIIATVIDNKWMVAGEHQVVWRKDRGFIPPLEGGLRAHLEIFRPTFIKEETFGTMGSADGQFFHPQGLAVFEMGGQASLFVADTGNNRVQQLTLRGNHIRSFGGSGTAETGLNGPADVSVSAGPIVYVADTQNDRIQVFDRYGSLLRSLVDPELRTEGRDVPDRLTAPQGLTIDSLGRLWVCDTAHGRLIELHQDNWIVAHSGDSTGLVTPFREPVDIAVSQEGQLFVADLGLGTILKADSVSGPWEELQFQTPSGDPVKRIQPWAVTIGSGTELYIADQGQGRVLVSTPSGHILHILEGLAEPSGLALDSSGRRLFISERASHRILAYEVTYERQHKEWNVSLP